MKTMTRIGTRPVHPISPRLTAQVKKKAASRSHTMKRMATREKRTSNWLRGSSNAGKPHSYSASLSGLGLWVPVRLDTRIGKNTKALDSTSATPRNSSNGRYSDRSTKETLDSLKIGRAACRERECKYG